MKLKRLVVSVLSTVILFATAYADYDPIDGAEIYDANIEKVSIIKGATAMFGKLYVANYDEDGRLVDVESSEIESIGGEMVEEGFSYQDIGIENAQIGSKIMLWSTYTNDMRPAKNTYTIKWREAVISDYSTASNNPTIVVKKVLDAEDGYTLVGYLDGAEVRYSINENTLVAKMVAPFNGSREYEAQTVWKSYYNDVDIKEILKPGDIVGYSVSANVFMIMVDAEELVDGVKSKNIPDLYNRCNFGVSAMRDSIIMGPLERAETNNNKSFIATQDYSMYVPNDAFIITVAQDGTMTMNAEMEFPGDLIVFDEETNTGDYVYVRYASKGMLQEIYVYRFE